MLEGPLSFHLSRCLDVPTDVCMDVGFSSTSKGKPLLSNENAMTNFRQTWYVGSGGTNTTQVVCRHRMRIFNTSFAYLFCLANNKKSNIQSSVWAALMKLGLWGSVGSDGHKYYPRSLSLPNAHI